MIYVLALIGAIALTYLVWKAFGPRPPVSADRRRGPIGPDDDSDFLLDLDRDGRRHPASDPTPHDPSEPDDPAGGAPHRDDPRPGTAS